MPRRPRNVSQRPATLELQDPRGDVLADVLGATLLRHALYKRIEARAPWGLRFASRERAVFYVIAHGTAVLEVDGQARVTLTAGQVAFVPHGEGHTLRDAPSTPSTTATTACDGKACSDGSSRRIGGTGARTTIVSGFFDQRGTREPALLERMPSLILLSPDDPGAGPSVAATVELLLAESAAPGPASAIVLQRLADVLFVQTLRSLTRHTACDHTALRALADPAIHRALDVMHARVDHAWTVARLASTVGLSRSAFAARFTDLVGEPPLQYLGRWRIARAAELLRETDDDLTAIAGRIGYESVPSFSKAFKRQHGVSPGAFRRTRA
jgi:AraC-like DNA-binding protein/mannose-6-phosphate isomerase-like protein (cupin superfamily)